MGEMNLGVEIWELEGLVLELKGLGKGLVN